MTRDLFHRKLLLLAFCGMLSGTTAFAYAPYTAMKMPTREQLLGEDACAMLAAYAVATISPDDMATKAGLCAKAEKETCQSTLEFVLSRKKQNDNYQRAINALKCSG